MIKALTVITEYGDSMVFTLNNPDDCGLAVTSIEGLAPGKANINTGDYSLYDGGMYNSARLPIRNIVITLKYVLSTDIEEARHKTYRYFPLKKQVILLIETDYRFLQISGYVESNEVTIFSKDEGSSISIVCPDPLFYDANNLGVKTTNLSGVNANFEFEFSNESLTENLLEMSTITDSTEGYILYEGDAEVGMKITFHAKSGSANNIVIGNSLTNEVMRFDSALTLNKGEDLVVCTMKKQKGIYKISKGVATNVMNYLDISSDWLVLRPGLNKFIYSANNPSTTDSSTDGTKNLDVVIENQIAYEGV